ncbi:methyltransferase domain-containing protein [Virgibacillus sp. NKC19-3]|uniref:class I SAM-dependent methyltransferase n=1 Tax=Virgibacillus saliphilus TaxID=2831674 RepID=UPI001C9BB6D9|nr:class I SAM-dependent methyltransferase [Virgibacillus sp. NKC19-3]MBY7144890.1 methyltransferase domain-containing protein [Virgibacillus sp. NKC19-3]
MVAKHESIKERITNHWNRRAELYDFTGHHDIRSVEQEELWLKRMKSITGDKKLDVLDVGCGTGFLSMLLAKQGHQVIGVDVASSMLEKARQKAKERGHSIDFHMEDAESLSFKDASFDLVINRFLISNISNPNSALSEWKRVLKADGKLAIIEGEWKKRLYQDEFREIGDSIPYYKGSAGERLKSVIEKNFFRHVELFYLHDPLYWDEIPEFERYILTANQ